MQSKAGSSWLFWTFLFALLSGGLVLLTRWRPVAGLAAMLVVAAVVFVGSVLYAYLKAEPAAVEAEAEYIQEKVYLPENQLASSKSLLRYATAILSFLSLITTAQGMKSFVFGRTWMAYLGSFAIQSILVVFSLLLCRFYVQIILLAWPSFVKRIAIGLLTLFFCVALVISSTFSFSYIANNAYARSRMSDSDTTIRAYLMGVVQELEKENERRGRHLLTTIPATARERLEPAMERAKKEELENYKIRLQTALGSIRGVSDVRPGAVDIDWSVIEGSAYASEAALLKSSYESAYKGTYDEAARDYEEIVELLSEMKGRELDDRAMDQVAEILSRIGSAKASLMTTLDAGTGIQVWRTSHFNHDIEPYRTTYTTAADRLLGLFTELEEVLEDAGEQVGVISGISQSNASQELDDILKDIYLLGVDESIDVSDLADRIAQLAVGASTNGSLESSGILDVISLRDDLAAYRDYLKLKSELMEFQEGNLNQVYYIKEGTAAAQAMGENCKVVTEEEWRDDRNGDFYKLYDLLKLLPEVELESSSNFDAGAVMREAGVLQRDMLGEVTDFERAFNYFKYDFRKMAFFSAFVAVFFDLGAFLTGCFLFCTEFFKTRERT